VTGALLLALVVPLQLMNPRPAAVARWELTDSSGQVWTDTNPGHLQRWVAQRNGAVAASVSARVAVRFSPGTVCETELIARLGMARRSVRMLAYSFTSVPVASALIAARSRGVDVAVVMDREQAAGRGSQLGALRAVGIPVTRDGHHPIMHDKVVIIDGLTVLTGSYNFSAQAGKNAENLLTLTSGSLAASYLGDWEQHAAHAIP
jgi:phosphatidylserine/phosphatidylglycerophosphate/cardiolipin synthase-like enzyme